MIELTLDRAKELLAEAVALKGEDYVYITPDGEQSGDGSFPPCWYVHDDEPGCIVGHVLHAAGVSLNQLRRVERNSALDAVSYLNIGNILTTEPAAAQLLQDAQMEQDTGSPWGEAQRFALARLD